MACKIVNITNKTVIKAGDLRYPITIYTRSISTPQNVDFNFDLSNFKVVRAGVNILNSINNVDGTNTNNSITHIFYVRYDKDATNAYLIKFSDKYYNVENTEDLDGRRNFLKLNTKETGTINNEVNLV